MSAQNDLGPVMPSRWQVYARARELRALAELAAECSIAGQRADLPRALGALDRMRAILGPPASVNTGQD